MKIKLELIDNTTIKGRIAGKNFEVIRTDNSTSLKGDFNKESLVFADMLSSPMLDLCTKILEAYSFIEDACGITNVGELSEELDEDIADEIYQILN
jgi:hypothetical protein